MFYLRAATVLLVAAVAQASCVTDQDCPSSYCVNDKTKSAPYSCHACGDDCCLTDRDCRGSYCQNSPDKTAPFFCHSKSSNPLEELLLNVQQSKDSEDSPAPAAPPSITPAAAADAEAIEDFLKKHNSYVAGVSIAVGLLFAFAGYRYFNTTLFLVGAAVTGFLSYAIMQTFMYKIEHNKIVGNIHLTPVVIILVTSVLAILGGLITYKLRKVGTFAAGAVGGAAAAVMLNASVLVNLPAPDKVTSLWLYIALVALGLFGGVLALKLERVVFILATSLTGSLAFVCGIGHFAGHFPTSIDSVVNHGVPTKSYWVWGYLGGFVLLVLVSTIVQFRHSEDKGKKRMEKYKNSLLYSAPQDNTGVRTAYVDHVSGYHTAV